MSFAECFGCWIFPGVFGKGRGMYHLGFIWAQNRDILKTTTTIITYTVCLCSLVSFCQWQSEIWKTICSCIKWVLSENLDISVLVILPSPPPRWATRWRRHTVTCTWPAPPSWPHCPSPAWSASCTSGLIPLWQSEADTWDLNCPPAATGQKERALRDWHAHRSVIMQSAVVRWSVNSLKTILIMDLSF